MGRAKSADLQLDDISISRIHCEVNVVEKKLFIKDSQSRYGTQILQKDCQVLNKKDKSQNIFQIGRTWLLASIQKEKKRSIFCCFFGKNIKINQSQDSIKNFDTNLVKNEFIPRLKNDIENIQVDSSRVFKFNQEFYDRCMSRNSSINKSYQHTRSTAGHRRENTCDVFLTTECRPDIDEESQLEEEEAELELELPTGRIHSFKPDEACNYSINEFSFEVNQISQKMTKLHKEPPPNNLIPKPVSPP